MTHHHGGSELVGTLRFAHPTEPSRLIKFVVQLSLNTYNAHAKNSRTLLILVGVKPAILYNYYASE